MATDLTPEQQELVKELKNAASNLSYYNAAEGDCYRAETSARNAAWQHLESMREKCREAGIDPVDALKGGSYLL